MPGKLSNRQHPTVSSLGIGLGLAMLLVGWPVVALSGDEPKPVVPLIDQVASVLDQIVPREMTRMEYPGIIIAVVCEDRFIVKGYGRSDQDHNRLAHPVDDRFAVASISKLVTATAIMQLVEQGRINVDEDAGSYLKSVKISPAFGTPITVSHLLLHSAGFEDRNVGTAARTLGDIPRLSDHLNHCRPERVYPPGSIISYSNYAYGLLGQIVEDVSGIPFARYVEEQVFRPLGMMGSTFEPLHADEPGMAVGYKSVDGRFERLPIEYARLVPAGGLRTSARDMALFMLAHLGGGQRENRILADSTTASMQTIRLRNHPLMPGRGYGFCEEKIGSVSCVGHTGETLGFNSSLLLVPEHRFGVFASANCNGKLPEMITTTVVLEFFARRLGELDVDSAVPTAPALQRFAGVFRTTRHSHTSFEKLCVLSKFMPQIEVSIAGDDLIIDGIQFQPRSNGVFHQRDGLNRVAFREEGDRVTHLFRGDVAFERLAWWETPRAHLVMLLCVAMAYLILLVEGVELIVRRKFRPARIQSVRPAWTLATAYLSIAAQISTGLALVWIIFVNEPRDLGFGPSRALGIALGLPWLIAGVSLLHCIGVALAWYRRKWSPIRLIQQSYVVFAEALACWLLCYWNLLNWRLLTW
ncbi:MAG: beta-lactamase family protein [Planctomycetes bacterium]|nr:beta-lactamase family protein [Planctomycetota bacterium]